VINHKKFHQDISASSKVINSFVFHLPSNRAKIGHLWYTQRASANELRAAIDVGRKQLSPNNKCHVIFIVFSKFYIKSAGGDGKFVVINKFRAFLCIICLSSCSEQKGHQFFLKGSHGRTVTSSAVYPLSLIPLTPDYFFIQSTKKWDLPVLRLVDFR
jgi:hypothetical protein